MNTSIKQSHLKLSGLFFNKYAIYCLSFLVLQQLIVASSSIWLVALIRAIQAEKIFLLYFGLYVASLILPFFPGGIAYVIVKSWQQESLRRFIQYFTEIHYNQISLSSEKDEKERRISALSTESSRSLEDAALYFYDFLATSLNVVLNILTIAFIVDRKLLLAYGLSLLVVSMLLKWQGAQQGRLALMAQDARILLGQSLLGFWDNIVLGNLYNNRLWQEKMWKRFEKAKELQIGSIKFQQIIAIGIAFLTLIPCLIIVTYSMITHASDTTFLASYVVILPRLFIILNFTHHMLSLIAQIPIHKNRLKTLISFLIQPEKIDILKRIYWDQIKIFKVHPSGKAQEIGDPRIIFDLVFSKGRFLVTGVNGSGKSSLLIFMKEKLKENVYYLPANHNLEFLNDGVSLSTGQQLIKSFEEIYQNVSEQIVLLDEWDANLDPSNCLKISQKIDELAKNKTVIEVRQN